MVQTLPAEDFSRTYSPNVVETFVQRIPGVTTNNVQGNEFATDLRYRGFAASPLQGTPQGSPSTCKAFASMKPSATPSTGT